MKKLILFLCIISFTGLFSQNFKLLSERDSILKILKNKDHLEKKNKQEIIKLFDKAYTISHSLNDENAKIDVLSQELSFRLNAKLLNGYEKKLKEALQLSENHKDYYNLTRFLTYHSWYFSQLGLYTKAERKLGEAENAAKSITDSEKKYERLHTIYLAHSVIKEGKNAPKDSVMYYVKKAHEQSLLRSADDSRRNLQLANTAIILASPDYAKDKKESYQYLKIAEDALNKADEKCMFTQVYRNYALIEHNEKNYQKSIEYCKKGIVYAKNYLYDDNLAEFYSLLSSNYRALNDYRNAFLYNDKYIKITDSLNAVNKDLLINSKIVEDENASAFTFINRYKYILLGILIFLVTVFIYDAKTNTKKEQIFEKKSNPNEIKTVSEEEIQSLISLAKTNEQAFYIKFSEIYPNFEEALKEKFQLNSSELKLSNYLFLNFDTKQIATFTNTSPKSVESKKYRLRKKLNLDSSEDLYSFIKNHV